MGQTSRNGAFGKLRLGCRCAQRVLMALDRSLDRPVGSPEKMTGEAMWWRHGVVATGRGGDIGVVVTLA